MKRKEKQGNVGVKVVKTKPCHVCYLEWSCPAAVELFHLDLTCMLPHMDDQQVFAGIAGLTQGALVGTVTCVSTSMNHQVSLVGEPRLAVLTSVWFFTCVSQNKQINCQ